MQCSPDDALNLLESWVDQETVQQLWLAPREGWAFRVVDFGRVEMFTADIIRLGLVSGGAMMVDLKNATFEYWDAREAPPHLRDVIDRDIVCTLQITTLEFRIALREMRVTT
jgi:hypothetical protein